MANHDQKQQQAGGRPDLQLSKEWRPRPSWTRRKFLLVRRYGAGTKSLGFEGSEARSRRNVRAFRLSFKTTKLAPATENSQQNAGLSRKLEPGGRIFRTTRQSAALGRSACKLIGTWFQVPFSRGCWHRDKMSRHTVFTVKTQLRGCLLYAAKACAEWGPHP